MLGLNVNLQNLEPVSSDCALVIEQGLDGLIREAVKRLSLPVTSDRRAAVHGSDISMICLGICSSSCTSGGSNLQYLEKYAASSELDWLRLAY